jgi:hypothetical protein
MHKSKRDIIIDEIVASKYCSTIWGGIREEHLALCIWVLRHECVLIDEGEKEVILWALN